MEIGATSLRLTHYPHGEPIYDLCDTDGIVLWTEIPLVGPGGYSGPGYVKYEPMEQQAKQVLIEMIRQHYNHPSVFFWGLYNELKNDFDNPVPFLKELETLAKKEDPTRLTTCATAYNIDPLNDVTDLTGWNKYYGWYGGHFSEIGTWADETHSKFPDKRIAVSEYGAGASPFKHTEHITAPDPGGKFHPEEWQTLFHENNWKELSARPFIWGKFVWVFSDFQSSIRTEGDKPGFNDKGLVTYDRQIKKDAFYFYKANWNPEPMLYITDRRNADRTKAITEVKVFTNIQNAELFLNGTSLGTRNKDNLDRIIWENVSLKKGKNLIEVKAKEKNEVLTDSCEWNLN